jgi:uncharacterized protein YprB with RNaseH-like and TPR domain
MADSGELRARLGELARARKTRMAVEEPRRRSTRRGGRGRDASPAPKERGAPGARARARKRTPAGFSAPAVGVEEFLPGGEWRDGPDFAGTPGTVYVHERLRSEIERRKSHWGRIQPPPLGEPGLARLAERGLDHALFLDLETCGLSSSTVFLAGTMHWNGEDFVLRQYFARHYGEEGPLLRALNEAMGGFEFLVTFNGKSYDVPFLQGRAVVHDVRLGLPPQHLDLLHPARRRWRDRLADCKLKTLESRVCRRRRAGDVPSEEVPGLYHDYVKHGDPYRLVPVFHHNLLDVITMGELLGALCRPEGRKPASR